MTPDLQAALERLSTVENMLPEERAALALIEQRLGELDETARRFTSAVSEYEKDLERAEARIAELERVVEAARWVVDRHDKSIWAGTAGKNVYVERLRAALDGKEEGS